MVRHRRLTEVEIPEAKEAIEWAKKLGAKGIPSPHTDEEWAEFEDLYFDLKEFIGFKTDATDIANSLSDLTTLLWNIKDKDNPDEHAFVTMNTSILAARDKVQNKYSIKILTLKELQEQLKAENEQ